MRPIAYEVRKRTSMDIDATETGLREALAAEGFGVLAEIDADAALREKLGLDVAADRTVCACNPPPAAQALAVESDGGLLLPCNVPLYEDGTVVSVLDPGTMVEITAKPAPEPIAGPAAWRDVAVFEISRKEGADA